MSKMKEFSLTLDEIINAGDDLVASVKKTAATAEIIMKAVKDLRTLLSDGDKTPQEIPQAAAPATPESEPKKEEIKTYSFQEVRGIMAGLSGQGKKAEAKALLTKFGVSRLSEVKPEDYAALVQEAQVIVNG